MKKQTRKTCFSLITFACAAALLAGCGAQSANASSAAVSASVQATSSYTMQITQISGTTVTGEGGTLAAAPQGQPPVDGTAGATSSIDGTAGATSSIDGTAGATEHEGDDGKKREDPYEKEDDEDSDKDEQYDIDDDEDDREEKARPATPPDAGAGNQPGDKAPGMFELNGESISFQLTSATIFSKSEPSDAPSAVTAEDLTVGAVVTVTLDAQGNALTVTLLRAPNGEPEAGNSVAASSAASADSSAAASTAAASTAADTAPASKTAS